MKYAWVVRPYPHGKYRVKEFLSKNIVAIGWPGIGDLTLAKTRDEIKKSISNRYRYSSPQSLGQAAGNIFRFMYDIKEGDFILVPDGQLVYIGKIISQYQYDKSVDSDEEGYPHQRRVEWLYDKKAIFRKLLTGRVYDSLKGQQTVFTTYHQDIEDTIKNKRHYFIQQSNFDLKNEYLLRLQQGLLRNINSNTFEDAVCSLFSNYFPGLRRLSTTSSEQGDTDLLTELPGGVNIRIQVKHFYPERGEIQDWVVEQLENSMETGDHGIIVTSGSISKSAENKANQYSDKAINFIDGQEFVDLLFENIDNMKKETLTVFGLRII